jgi:hypothetical protein
VNVWVPTPTVILGWALRLWYQFGWVGEPPLAAQDYTARVAAVSGATPRDRLVAPGVARSVALKVGYLTMRNLEEYRQSNVGTRSLGWKQALQRNSQDLWIGVPR